MMTPSMARIRIVDEWLRSPVSSPTRHRAIMVIAVSWSEQRVLMRAFAGSADQTRPTIVLHGSELAIGPAGTDPHGHWGIHVEPPVDGRAQELRQQLELAAKRLAGSKGNPPRLLDEESPFERKATNNWQPGAPRDRRTLMSAPRVEAGDPTDLKKTVELGRAVRGSPPPMTGVAPGPPGAAPGGSGVSPTNDGDAPGPPGAAPGGSARYAGGSGKQLMRTMPPMRKIQGGIPNPASSGGMPRSTPGAPQVDSSVNITPPPMPAAGDAPAPDAAATESGRKPAGYAAAYASAATPPQPTPSAAPGQAGRDPRHGWGRPPNPPAAGGAARPRRRKGWTSPIPPAGSEVDRRARKTPLPFDGAKTTPGFAPMAAPVRPMPRAKRPSSSGAAPNFASTVGHTMPLGFRLSGAERDVLNALGKKDALRASEVAAIAGVPNGIEWMEQLMSKLSEHGIDLIMPGDDAQGEPTYVLRR